MTESTQIANREVLAAWRTGPRWYHVVVALIDDPEVERRRQAIARALGDNVALSAPGQPHVTIWAAGFEPGRELPNSGHIPVTVGGADLFRSAAYLTATGTGVDRVRSRLLADGLVEDRDEEFVAHVTVGPFQRVVPLAVIRDQLSPFRDLPPLPVTASIRHLAVDTRCPVGRLAEPPTNHS